MKASRLHVDELEQLVELLTAFRSAGQMFESMDRGYVPTLTVRGRDERYHRPILVMRRALRERGYRVFPDYLLEDSGLEVRRVHRGGR